MITKQYNGYVGYGSSDKEAVDSCRIISILKGVHNIKGFEGLQNRRSELSPWKPKQNSLHIHGVGYIRLESGSIKTGNVSIKASSNLFEMLYKCFYYNLSIVDIAVCSIELQEFFNTNKIMVPLFSSYEQVIPEDVFMLDEHIVSYVIFDNYSIVFFKQNKVALKRNAEELYWVCNFNNETYSTVEALYYIAYVRGYEGIDRILRGGN